MAQPQALPLLFSFVQVVIGNGFIASVCQEGRALLEVDHLDDGDETWITGVTPVGITGGGADRSAAYNEFRRAWSETLFDLAHQASSFDDFHQLCASFFLSEQAAVTTLWDDALNFVRSQKYEDESLRREEAPEHEFGFCIEEITDHELAADKNGSDAEAKVAA